MELGLKGKVAIVTGGTQGIGRATALRLAQEGANVAICARSKEDVERVGAEIAKTGSQVLATQADMSKAEDIERFMKAVADSTQQQRVIAAEKATTAIEDLKKKGMTFFPMSASDRATVRKEMQSKLWADFAKQYPATAPLFDAINKARG